MVDDSSPFMFSELLAHDYQDRILDYNGKTNNYLIPSLFMDFNEYKNKFIEQAIDAGYTDAEIAGLLYYASRLNSESIPIIYDQEHLALLLGLDLPYLLAMANSNRKFYKQFQIPKKNGGKREIEQPLPNLLKVQYWILENILQKCSIDNLINPSAKAFINDVSLSDNITPHVNQDLVVSVDIKDFFTSISFFKVYGLFLDIMGYNKEVAVLLAKLCTFNDFLPQGAPTSPILSNMVFSRLDESISSYCQHRGYNYTRYADDLTFSGSNIKVKLLLRYIQGMLGRRGYQLNEEKTKIMGRASAQYVTGCTVNHKANVPRKYREKIRQEVYHLKTKGLTEHFSKVKNLPPIINTPQAYLNHLLGKVYYVLQINPKEKEFIDYKDYLKQYIKNLQETNPNS